jgi:hypothetical protein
MTAAPQTKRGEEQAWTENFPRHHVPQLAGKLSQRLRRVEEKVEWESMFSCPALILLVIKFLCRKIQDTPRLMRTNVKKCIDEVLNEDDDDFGDSDIDSCYSGSDEEDTKPLATDDYTTPKKELFKETKIARKVLKEVKLRKF